MKYLSIVLLIFLLSSTSYSQQNNSIPISAAYVEDLNMSQAIRLDGLYISDDSTIYVAEGWDGNEIFKVLPDGTVESFASGLSGPIDIVKGLDGNFYVSEWTGSGLAKITPDGVVTDFATISPGPGPMTIDGDGNIFVTHNVNNNSGIISMVTPDGTVSVFASGSPLINPGGIDIDENGNTYVANFNNGNIIKIEPDLTMTIFSNIPVVGTWKTGHLKYVEGNLFVSAISDHRIYKVDMNGEAEVYAGTGNAGHEGGTLEEAQFNNPNGLAVSSDNSELFVSNGFNSVNYIQKIVFSGTVTTEENRLETGFELYQNSPNPSLNNTTIAFRIFRPEEVSVKVYNGNGTLVSTIVDTFLTEGSYKYHLTTSGFPEGIYYYELRSNSGVETKKIIVL